jgi:hypothetical protein
MLKEILEVASKTGTRSLLPAFSGIALYTLSGDHELLSNPVSWYALIIPVLVLVSKLLFRLWVEAIRRITIYLSDDHQINNNVGPFLGSCVLTFCVLVTFSWLAPNHANLSAHVLVEPGFIRLCALYLFAIETVRLKFRQVRLT